MSSSRKPPASQSNITHAIAAGPNPECTRCIDLRLVVHQPRLGERVMSYEGYRHRNRVGLGQRDIAVVSPDQ
jgi:hypothetical protein